MTKPIKLAVDDFSYIHWDKDSGGPESFELIIHGKSKYNCEKIKEQILENQKKAEKYDDYTNCCQHSDDEYCIWNHELHIAEQKIRSLEKKLTNKNIKHLHKKDLDNLKDYREKFLENKKIIEKIKQIQSLLINNKKLTSKEQDILEFFTSMSVFEFIKKYSGNSQMGLQNEKEVI